MSTFKADFGAPYAPKRPSPSSRRSGKATAAIVIALILAAAFAVWIARYDRSHRGAGEGAGATTEARPISGGAGPAIMWGGRR